MEKFTSQGLKKVWNNSRPALSLSSLLPFPSPPFPFPPFLLLPSPTFPSRPFLFPPLPSPPLPLEVGPRGSDLE